MKALASIGLIALILSACSIKQDIDTSIHDAASTASGAIDDVQDRVGHVKSGWEKFMDAISEFKKAAGDTSSQ